MSVILIKNVIYFCTFVSLWASLSNLDKSHFPMQILQQLVTWICLVFLESCLVWKWLMCVRCCILLPIDNGLFVY